MQKQGPKVFAVSGIKNSGKTTLIEKIVKVLTAKGYRVGVIKHDGHEFKADHEGTDSYRHKMAGAENVIVYSSTQVMMIKDRQEMTDIKALIDLQQDMDLVILEGQKHSDFPKIEIVRSMVSRESVCKKETLLAICTDTNLRIDGVPTVGINDIEAILEIIEAYINTSKE